MGEHKKALLVCCVFAALGILTAVQDYRDPAAEAANVTRGSEGTESESRTFTYRSDGAEGEITLDVNAVQRTRQESEKLLEQAVDLWNRQYLGRNPSAAQVREDLDLPDSLCDGLVTVAYESSDAVLLGADGQVAQEQISENGNDVELRAEFACGPYTRVEIRQLHLVLPEKGSREWLSREIQAAAEKAESGSRENAGFTLPVSVDGHTVTWENRQTPRWLYFVILGPLAAFCFEWREKERQKKELQRRNDRLLAEYPQMVEQMALLLGSGMTVFAAWERLLATNRQLRGETGNGEKLVIREMRITYREIREGCGEREAYERFGDRIGLLPYRRFAAILSQNLKKGTRDVREMLSLEAAKALELRKNYARKLGEEAGTKLLFPMLLMFVLILLVLLFPAAQDF